MFCYAFLPVFQQIVDATQPKIGDKRSMLYMRIEPLPLLHQEYEAKRRAYNWPTNRGHKRMRNET